MWYLARYLSFDGFRMPDCAALLALATRNPRGLRFEQLCALAECFGFVHRKSKRGTSHRLYKREGIMQLLNFQPDRNGMAKPYQVMQLLVAIERLVVEGKADS